MTDTINVVAAEAAAQEEPAVPALDERGVAEQLVAQAREKGIELVGPNGLLSQLTKRVLEAALEAEMSEHLGYEKHDPVGRNHGNSRNGVRSKTVLTEIGPVEIEVPRDLDASFQPTIVKKRQRRTRCALPVRQRANHGGDLGALRRGLRRLGAARDSLEDHRPGAGGDGRLDESAAG
jgi:type III secretion system FlhB-like substrate exporter